MTKEVLCGAENKRIRDNRLDKIPEYGIYKSLSVDEVRTVVDWMISEHYILKTRGKYPVLHSTYEGLHYSDSITEGKLKKLKKRLEGNKMLDDRREIYSPGGMMDGFFVQNLDTDHISSKRRHPVICNF